MMEIGPFRMDPNNPGSLTLLDWGGWEEFAGVVFGEPHPACHLLLLTGPAQFFALLTDISHSSLQSTNLPGRG